MLKLRAKSKVREEPYASLDLSQVVDLGEGPNTILFLHGLFGTPEHWFDVMERLSDRYRVIAPQLPIDPQPDRRRNGMKKIGDLSAAVTELVERLELGPIVLCGNSLGGLVAIDICIGRPELASGLVLAGSAGLFEKSPIRGLRSRPDKEFVRSTIHGILHDHSLVTDELVEKWHHSVIDRDYARFLLRVSRATRDRCVEEELSQLDLPSLIIWGRDDEITPPSTGEEFQRRIKGSKIVFLDECGHAPNWEQPAVFAEVMDDFLPACFS